MAPDGSARNTAHTGIPITEPAEIATGVLEATPALFVAAGEENPAVCCLAALAACTVGAEEEP